MHITHIMQKLKPHMWYVLGLVFLGLLAMHPFLIPNASYHSGDFRLIHQTTPVIMKEALSEGGFPLWTRYIESGIPFFAVPDKPFSYLPFLSLLSFLNPYTSLNWSIVLHVIFAGIAMYALAGYLLRKHSAISDPRPAAFVAGVLWIMNSYLITRPPFWIMSVSWTPLVFLFLFMAFSSKKWVLYSMLAGLSLSMMVHAGGVFQFYMVFLFTLPVFAFKLLVPKFTRKKFTKFFLVGLLFVIFFLGFSAIRLMPYTDWVEDTNRVHALDFDTTKKESISFMTAWSEFVKGDGQAQIGIVGLLFLVLSGFYYAKTKDKNALLFWILLLGILLIASALLHQFLYDYIPGFDKQRGLGRTYFIFTFTASLLGAYGFLWLQSKLKKQLSGKILIGVLIMIGIFSYVDAISGSNYNYPDLEPYNEIIDNNHIVQYIANQTSLNPNGEQFYRMHQYEIRGIDWNDVQAVTIPQGVDMLFGHYGGIWMPFFLNDYLAFATQNPLKVWGILNVKYITSSEPLESPDITLIHVFDEYDRAYPEWADGPYLYENKLTLPRAFNPGHTILIIGSEDEQKQGAYWSILQPEFNTLTTTVIASDFSDYDGVTISDVMMYDAIVLPGSTPSRLPKVLRDYVAQGGIVLPDIENGQNSIDEGDLRRLFTSYEQNHIESEILAYNQNDILIKTTEPILVVSEKYVWFDDWHADVTYADGSVDEDIPILKAYGGISAVSLPYISDHEGEATVHFFYKPKAYILGKWITVVTTLLALLLIFMTLRKKDSEENHD